MRPVASVSVSVSVAGAIFAVPACLPRRWAQQIGTSVIETR
jgi:hypothetical protein